MYMWQFDVHTNLAITELLYHRFRGDNRGDASPKESVIKMESERVCLSCEYTQNNWAIESPCIKNSDENENVVKVNKILFSMASVCVRDETESIEILFALCLVVIMEISMQRNPHLPHSI